MIRSSPGRPAQAWEPPDTSCHCHAGKGATCRSRAFLRSGGRLRVKKHARNHGAGPRPVWQPHAVMSCDAGREPYGCIRKRLAAQAAENGRRKRHGPAAAYRFVRRVCRSGFRSAVQSAGPGAQCYWRACLSALVGVLCASLLGDTPWLASDLAVTGGEGIRQHGLLRHLRDWRA